MAVAAAVAACLVWAATIPLAGTPDERQHLVYAASLWQGQLTSPERVDVSPGRVATESVVTVPGAYAHLADRYRCFWTNNPTREGCVLALPTDASPTEATTRAGRYPPAYHLVVGPGTRSASAAVGITAARVLTALLAGLPLGLAAAVAVRRRRGVVLALAVTPYTLYLGGLVNPSGWEITSSLALWVGALAWLDDDGDRLALATLAVGLVGTVLARPIGPVIAAGIMASAVVARGQPTRLRAAWRQPAVRGVVVLAAAAVVAAVAWLAWRDPTGALTGTPMPDVGTGQAVRQVVSDLPTHLREMVWNAVGFPPTAVAAAWLAAGGVAVVAALWLGSARDRMAIGLVAAATVVLPIVGTLQSVHDVGFVWQGRYGQPVTVGLVVLASWVLAERLTPAIRTGIAATTATLTMVVHAWSVQGIVAHWTAWPREATRLFEPGRVDGWTSPLPAPLLVAGMLVATGLLGLALARSIGREPAGA